MSLTVGELAGLGGLGDSLRVGPQWAWPTAQGTPVIQRGPHGQRFAPIPSESPGTGVRFWRESESPGFAEAEWVPRPAVVGVMGMRGLGAGLPELSDDGKNGLTKIARDLVGRSQSAEGAALQAVGQQARIAFDTLAKYQTPFEAGSWALPVALGGWDSSQTIKANLQAALNNVQVRGGVRGGAVHGRQTDVSVGTEFAKNVASPDFVRDVGKSAEELAADARRAAGATPTALKVVGAVAAVALGAYALRAVTDAKRAFTNPKRRRASHPARPASFRYE